MSHCMEKQKTAATTKVTQEKQETMESECRNHLLYYYNFFFFLYLHQRDSAPMNLIRLVLCDEYNDMQSEAAASHTQMHGYVNTIRIAKSILIRLLESFQGKSRMRMRMRTQTIITELHWQFAIFTVHMAVTAMVVVFLMLPNIFLSQRMPTATRIWQTTWLARALVCVRTIKM